MCLYIRMDSRDKLLIFGFSCSAVQMNPRSKFRTILSPSEMSPSQPIHTTFCECNEIASRWKTRNSELHKLDLLYLFAQDHICVLYQFAMMVDRFLARGKKTTTHCWLEVGPSNVTVVSCREVLQCRNRARRGTQTTL